MTNEEIFERYIPLVKFISQLCGPACEVVLHNIENPNNSVLAIENGYHSNRTIGSPLTDLGKQFIEQKVYEDNDFISNYDGSSKGKQFICSTYFIKNQGKLIGLLCINRDLNAVSQLEDALAFVRQQFNFVNQTPEYKETFATSANSFLIEQISQEIKQAGIQVRRMSIQEKVEVVKKLKAKGILTIKGAVSEVAKQLDVSEPTIYRYISKEK